MNDVERLRRDHGLFREHVQAMESTLSLGRSVRFMIRDGCLMLAKQLREHLQREARLAADCAMVLGRYGLEELRWLGLDHQPEAFALRVVNQGFKHERWSWLEQPQSLLLQCFDNLRNRMDQQDAHLFPLLARTINGQHAPQRASHRQTRDEGLLEGVTGYQVVIAYPETEAVFERLFINIAAEGYYELGELAWRHGIASRQLLNELRGVMSARHRTPRAAETLASSCLAMS